MKTIRTIIIAAMSAAAICQTSCESDDSIEQADIEYAFLGICTFYNQVTAEDSTFIENAFKEAGVPLDGYKLVLAGQDSAAVSLLLAEKTQKLEELVTPLSKTLSFTLEVKGAEKMYIDAENDKEHPIRRWYQKEIGFPVVTSGDDVSMVRIEGGHEYRFVTGLDAVMYEYFWKSPFYSKEDDHTGPIIYDLNEDAGGKYIFLQFQHKQSSVSEGKAGEFKWDDNYADKYITHVIAVYGGNPPATVTVEGRKYTRATEDLNKGAGGEWIWLYTTTDPAENEGHPCYLNTGGPSDFCSCQVRASSANNIPFFIYLRMFEGMGRHVYGEVVQAYDTNGHLIGDAEFNKGAGGQYIYMILIYCTKDPV